jgi:Fur family ferric uptake transcriptional regulator
MRTTYTTRPREQIAQILQSEQRYLSAAEIHDRLQRSRAKVALSTVYRTLDLLESKGVASSRVDENGETTYVACAATHHHHAICRDCGKVEEVGCQAIERVADALVSHHGFQLDEHAMEFFGRCKSCR